MSVAVQIPFEATRIVLAHERPFRLGAVEVRPATREVISPKGRRVLEPRVMQVLVALGRAGGETVSRDELVARCWDGRAVGEDAISRVISQLRRLTETVGAEDWTLETITKVGYRLHVSKTEPLPAPRAGQPSEKARPDRRMLIGGAAGVVAAVGGGAWWARTRPKGSRRAQVLVEKAGDALAQGSPRDAAQAIAFLREAVADSPEYAAAWGALALAYQANLTFTEPSRQPAGIQLARAAANRGLELDPRDPDSLAALASLVWKQGDLLAVERRFIAAGRQGDARSQAGYARLLMEVGRMRESVDPSTAAVQADGFAPWLRYGLGLAQWGAGRPDEAEQTARKGLQLWPGNHALWFLLFNVLSFTGRADQALAFARDPAFRPGEVPPKDLELSLVAARAMASRAAADIEAALAMQLEAAHRGVGYAENAVTWSAAFGRFDAAFAVARAMYLNQGFHVPDQRFSAEQGRYNVAGSRHTHLLFMPPTEGMRRDPRFLPLVRDMGLVRYWQASGRLPDDPNVARLVSR